MNPWQQHIPGSLDAIFARLGIGQQPGQQMRTPGFAPPGIARPTSEQQMAEYLKMKGLTDQRQSEMERLREVKAPHTMGGAIASLIGNYRASKMAGKQEEDIAKMIEMGAEANAAKEREELERAIAERNEQRAYEEGLYNTRNNNRYAREDEIAAREREAAIADRKARQKHDILMQQADVDARAKAPKGTGSQSDFMHYVREVEGRFGKDAAFEVLQRGPSEWRGVGSGGGRNISDAGGKQTRQLLAKQFQLGSTLQEIERARDIIANEDFSTGPLASFGAQVPWLGASTPGGQLNNIYTTLKSRLSFDRLQQMRDWSVTGGALGNVSNYELEMLMTNVANLQLGSDDPDQLYRLAVIEEHTQRLLTLASIDLEKERFLNQGMSPEEAEAWSVSEMEKAGLLTKYRGAIESGQWQDGAESPAYLEEWRRQKGYVGENSSGYLPGVQPQNSQDPLSQLSGEELDRRYQEAMRGSMQ